MTATFLPVRTSGGFGRHPSFVERLLDDGHFDRLDRHRIVVDAEHARALRTARGRAGR